MWSWPPASTATVPVARLARWAAASMPRASPETTAKPAAPKSRASRSAKRTPAADALRAPTSATAGSLSATALPRNAKSGGASSIIFRRGGELGSPRATNAAPDVCAAVSSRRAPSRAGMRAGPLAPPRRGQGGRGGSAAAGAAVMIDERAEGARADVVAADEAQPIEPLLVGEPHPPPSIADAHDGHNPDARRRNAYGVDARRQAQ